MEELNTLVRQYFGNIGNLCHLKILKDYKEYINES